MFNTYAALVNATLRVTVDGGLFNVRPSLDIGRGRELGRRSGRRNCRRRSFAVPRLISGLRHKLRTMVFMMEAPNRIYARAFSLWCKNLFNLGGNFSDNVMFCWGCRKLYRRPLEIYGDVLIIRLAGGFYCYWIVFGEARLDEEQCSRTSNFSTCPFSHVAYETPLVTELINHCLNFALPFWYWSPYPLHDYGTKVFNWICAEMFSGVEASSKTASCKNENFLGAFRHFFAINPNKIDNIKQPSK